MKFEIYRARRMLRGEWRWRLRAQNGRIIANSGEGYRNFHDCRGAIDLVMRSADSQLTVNGKPAGGAVQAKGSR